jgi:Rrf2 family protein
MKISSRLDYAVSCAVHVADAYYKKIPATVSYIAEREGIEPDYAEQLLIKMKRAGILKSIRGPAGGYVLKSDPSNIKAADIVKAIENNILEPVCFRKRGRRRKCRHLNDCKIKILWQDLADVMEERLESYSLAKLLSLRKKEKNWLD